MIREADTRPTIISAINVGEVYYIVSRNQGEDIADKFLDLIGSTSVRIDIPDFNLVIESAKVKAFYRVSYADAFAIATTVNNKAIVVTGDPEFREVEDIVEVDWL